MPLPEGWMWNDEDWNGAWAESRSARVTVSLASVKLTILDGRFGNASVDMPISVVRAVLARFDERNRRKADRA